MNPRNQARNQYPSKPATMSTAREIAAQRPTCQGCHALQTWPRPQCKGEASPFFRMVRDTYHDRCAAYAYRTAATPEPEAPPMSRYAIAGEVKTGRKGVKPVDQEHAALLTRNASRKVES